MLAPICLFTYNRLNHTKRTVTALRANFLAKESTLYVFSDGAKNQGDLIKVKAVRAFLSEIKGFKSIIHIEKNENIGLGNSIIQGVTQVIEEHGKAIVLEDDLETTPNFLDYMNQALSFYETDKRLLSICGYGLKIERPDGYPNNFYLYGRSSSWGWGTWQNRWKNIDWDVKDWETFKNDEFAIKSFNKNGSDMFGMLSKYIRGKNSSWAIRFCYHQFRHKKFALVPFKSYVQNIGFDGEGTNTKNRFSRFKAVMEPGIKRNFQFDANLDVCEEIQKECYRYHSLKIRLYSKFRYLLNY